jgi:hypothetical protein
MELERVKRVAQYYIDYLDARQLRSVTAGYIKDFAGRLISMIEEEPERREKIMRWYGFIQGALWAIDVFSVEEFKNHSRPDMPAPFFTRSKGNDWGDL